jgi:hypothetical protein
VARTRTTKKLAQRIDLNYFKRPTPLKRARFWLSVLLPLLALLWIAERTIFKDSRVYSSGRLSEAHAVLEKECAACHVQQAGAFSAKAADNACLACHDGPIHHANQTRSLECAACHMEHRGRVNLRAASNQSCAECHGDLKATGGSVHFASRIRGFEDGHPEFAALRDGGRDPGTIKVNHSIHMKPIRRGPNGPIVNLVCGDCHRPAMVSVTWAYADFRSVSYTPTYARGDLENSPPEGSTTLKPSRPISGRELMAPVKFATACAGCHSLAFDKRFEEGVPHDTPEVIDTFLRQKFAAYIAGHSNELREMQNPDRELTGKRLPPSSRVLTPGQWVVQQVAIAEELLWHKTCAQCHTLAMTPLQDTSIARWEAASAESSSGRGPNGQAESIVAESGPRPTVASAKITTRWMPHAKFDHAAHTGFTCVSCHEKALTSTETSDILLPGIATCQKCHAPGAEHAESRCFECHTYHDWSKRKEVTPTFTLPALRTGQIGGEIRSNNGR